MEKSPAQCLGIADRLGSLEAGTIVDVVVIDQHGGLPVVARAGHHVFAAGDRAAPPVVHV